MTPIHLRNGLKFHDHMSLLEHLAQWLKPERYLEIGVLHGESMKKIQHYAQECYGVDVTFSHRNYNNNVKLFEMPSDQFFANLDPSVKFDMVFIDGDHEKNQVYKDFINSKDRVIDDGLVILHDTVPMNEEMTAHWFCHSAWEAAQKIKKEVRDEWEVLSLPFNPGITIMRKINWNKQLIWKL
jgi:predicted O-methyltransferase YrrM